MKFEINRVSGIEPPCSEAYKDKARWTNSYGPQEEDAWFIDLDPKDLTTFADKYDSIILDRNCYSDDCMHISIYDDYNE